MENNNDKFQSIFQNVEREAQISGNAVKFVNKSQTSNDRRKNTDLKRYTVQKSTDSRIIPITPKRLAKEKKDKLSRIEAKKAKIMLKYEKQLRKVGVKEQKQKIKLAKQAHRYQVQLDKKTQREQADESKRRLKLSKKESKQKYDKDKRVYKKVKVIEKSVKAEDKQIAKEKEQQERMNKILNKQQGSKRLTPSKKRNIFVRFHHMRKYINSDLEYEAIEEDLQDYKKGKLSDEYIESEWEDIQEYEDARDDVKLRRGWTVFKVTLAGIALAGSLFACKAIDDNIHDMQVRAEINVTQADIDFEIKRAETANLRLEDQQFFYEYTNGNPSLENWNNLPQAIQKNVRNPVIAAEAASKFDNDQAHFYVMTKGEISTEAWNKLPEELKQYIREPVSTAKEAFEEGKDQMYLYKLSRGQITNEFWQSLPEEVKQYVRNPLELAKEFAENGDVSGYMNSILLDDNRTEKDRHVFWSFLPDELKEYVQDPSIVNAEKEIQTNIDDEIGER